jgi:hypothetical protein
MLSAGNLMVSVGTGFKLALATECPQGCAEGRSPLRMAPNSKFGISKEDASCRESEGIPQVFFSPQEWGTKGLNQGDAMTVQQNAAGVWGVPSSLVYPPRLGD